MKLYDSRRAPNPRRVRWFMAEKGITDIEVVQIDIFKGEHRTPEYLAEVGLPVVPALVLDDGTAITEASPSAAISKASTPSRTCSGGTPRKSPSSKCGRAGRR